MSTAYLTHDEVNAAFAAELAARAEVALTVLDARDAAGVAAADRVVLDLDFLPPEFKAELLARADRGEDLGWAGVHSYRLTTGESRRLRRAGAAVRRTLSAGLFLPAAGGWRGKRD